MRKIYVRAKTTALIAAFLLFWTATIAFSQSNAPFSLNASPLPSPTGFVNDYAGVIDPATKQQLETKIKQFKDSTNPSVELAVAIVHTTGDRPIFDYSLAVARGWKIGSKEQDNPSALLFIAIDDRKYFTQVSKDLEDECLTLSSAACRGNISCPSLKKAITAKASRIRSTLTFKRSMNEKAAFLQRLLRAPAKTAESRIRCSVFSVVS
jgi:Beta-propeller domains of methanol dehydrogenase type